MEAKRITLDAFVVLFAGLATAACQKSAPDVSAEKSPAPSAGPATAASAKVEATEVGKPASSASAEAEKSCAPGGCAPGKCGGKEEK